MPVRFAFLTDTHHYPDAPHDYGAPKMLTRSQEVLDAMIAEDEDTVAPETLDDRGTSPTPHTASG